MALVVVRAASIAAGVYIEYRQVYGSRAQLDLIGLGLLFICVPPASWLDTLAKVSKVADAMTTAATEAEGSREPPMRRSSDRKTR